MGGWGVPGNSERETKQQRCLKSHLKIHFYQFHIYFHIYIAQVVLLYTKAYAYP